MATATATATATSTTLAVAKEPASTSAMARPRHATERPPNEVNIAEAVKKPFPRYCVLKLDAGHWPCLLFPSTVAMVAELAEFKATKDRHHKIIDGTLVDTLAWEFLDTENSEGPKVDTPVLLLLGIDEVDIDFAEEALLTHAAGVPGLITDKEKNPEIAKAVRAYVKIHALYKPKKNGSRIRSSPTAATGRKGLVRAAGSVTDPSAKQKSTADAPTRATVASEPVTDAVQTAVTATSKPGEPEASVAEDKAMSSAPDAKPTPTDKATVTQENAKTPSSVANTSGTQRTTSTASIATEPTAVVAKPPQVAHADANTKPAASPKETIPDDESQREKSGQELMAEAKELNAGFGPLIVAPEVSLKRHNRIAPSEYQACRGGPSIENYAASIENKASRGQKPLERISTSEYRQIQGGPSIPEYHARLMEEAKANHLAASRKEAAADESHQAESTTPEEPGREADETKNSPTETQAQNPGKLSSAKEDVDEPMEDAQTAEATPPSMVANATSDTDSSAQSTSEAESSTKAKASVKNKKRTQERQSKRIRSTRGSAKKTQPMTRVPKPTPPTALLDTSTSPQESSIKEKREKDIILDTWQQEIPTLMDVIHELEKLGFGFQNIKSRGRQPKYFFPSYYKKKKVEAVLGEDYFTTERAFRARLCSHGFGSEVEWLPDFTTGSAKKLEHWIRLSIVKSLPEELESSYKTWGRMFKVLQVLGFDCRRCDTYFFKEARKDDDIWISENGKYKEFLAEKDLLVYLSRHGLPEECHFEKITEEERFLLELTLSRCDRDLNPPPEGGRRRKKSYEQHRPKRRNSKTADAVPPSKKQRSEASRNGNAMLVDNNDEPSGAPVPSHEKAPVVTSTPIDHDEASLATDDCVESASAASMQSDSIAKVSSPMHCDKDALAKCNRKPLGGTRSARTSRRDLRAAIEKTSSTKRDEANEIKSDSDELAKLNSCLETLEKDSAVDYEKETGIVFGPPNSQFRKNTFAFYELMESLAESRVVGAENGTNFSPAALYLCGQPGIGKTTAVNWCCRKLTQEFACAGQWGALNIEPAFVDINCAQLGSTTGISAVRKKVLGEIWTACTGSANYKESNKGSLVNMMTSTKTHEKKRFVVLVLDEIDQLPSPDSESENPATSGEKLMKELSGWSSDSSYRFVLIGIGNSQNNNRYRRIVKFIELAKSFSFQTYDESHVLDILQNRVKGVSCVDPKAITMIAKKACNIRGDAREAIEMLTTVLRDAKEKAQQAADESQQSSAPKGQYLVTIRDVVKLGNGFTKLVELMKNQPMYTKLVVFAAVSLAIDNESSGSRRLLTRRELINSAMCLFHDKVGEYVEDVEINGSIGRLDDCGILRIEENVEPWGFHDQLDDTIRFEHLPQELEAATLDALGEDHIFF